MTYAWTGLAERGYARTMTGDRLCRACHRPLRKRALRSAVYCSDVCRANAGRERKEQAKVRSDFSRRLEEEILRYAPAHAAGYALAYRDSKAGPLLVFPDPTRRTQRADGAFRKSEYFRLRPFESPAVPVVGSYQIFLFDLAGQRIPTPPELTDGRWISEACTSINLNDGHQIR